MKNLGLSGTVERAENAISKNDANEKFLPRLSNSGAQVGALTISSDNDWPGIIFETANRYRIGIEGTWGKTLTIWANDSNGERRYGLLMPEKSGTIATVEDVEATTRNLPMLSVGQSVITLTSTSARSLGVNYANQSGKPIAACVRVIGGTSAVVKIFVNNIDFGSGHSTAMNISAATAFSIVSNGATYRVESLFTIEQWTELR
ncbi:hypothetical protein [Xenorhabdus szentirmaii]|uniref:hypothetical protein n=1 Tax=Xenorhabdus szentirmaii TaxID=290112 RepID=UPI0019ADE6CE|nr:hypothetical protein [Xenorhabdus sp. 38]MBD2782800.1 hypothetical protein [Xenorhabdus sp. 38]